MYVICYTDANGEDVWEVVYGEDAMQIRVSELFDELLCNDEDIMVFDIDSQL